MKLLFLEMSIGSFFFQSSYFYLLFIHLKYQQFILVSVCCSVTYPDIKSSAEGCLRKLKVMILGCHRNGLALLGLGRGDMGGNGGRTEKNPCRRAQLSNPTFFLPCVRGVGKGREKQNLFLWTLQRACYILHFCK